MRKLLAGLVLLLTAACGDGGTEPEPPPPPFVVTIPAGQNVQGVMGVQGGLPAYQCPTTISVSTTGGASDEFALWEGASITFRLNSNGQQSSSFLGTSDLAAWFGSDRLVAGRPATASRLLYWQGFNAGPFSAFITLQYRVMSTLELRSATFTLNCN